MKESAMHKVAGFARDECNAKTSVCLTLIGCCKRNLWRVWKTSDAKFDVETCENNEQFDERRIYWNKELFSEKRFGDTAVGDTICGVSSLFGTPFASTYRSDQQVDQIDYSEDVSVRTVLTNQPTPEHRDSLNKVEMVRFCYFPITVEIT